MSDQIPRLVHAAALVSLMLEVLDQDEFHHLADDRLRADLRGLRARIDAELEERSGRKRLRVAEDDSVSED